MTNRLIRETENVHCALAFNNHGEVEYIGFGETAKEAATAVKTDICDAEPGDTTLYRIVVFDMQHPDVIREVFDVLGRGADYVQVQQRA